MKHELCDWKLSFALVASSAFPVLCCLSFFSWTIAFSSHVCQYKRMKSVEYVYFYFIPLNLYYFWYKVRSIGNTNIHCGLHNVFGVESRQDTIFYEGIIIFSHSRIDSTDCKLFPMKFSEGMKSIFSHPNTSLLTQRRMLFLFIPYLVSLPLGIRWDSVFVYHFVGFWHLNDINSWYSRCIGCLINSIRSII